MVTSFFDCACSSRKILNADVHDKVGKKVAFSEVKIFFLAVRETT